MTVCIVMSEVSDCALCCCYSVFLILSLLYSLLCALYNGHLTCGDRQKSLSAGLRYKWRGWALMYGGTSARRRRTDRRWKRPTQTQFFQQPVKRGDLVGCRTQPRKRLWEQPAQVSSIHLGAYIPLLFPPKTLSGEPLRAGAHTEGFKQGQHQAIVIVGHLYLPDSHFALHLLISMVLNKGCSSLQGYTSGAEVHFHVFQPSLHVR
ncbi:hypothetical protein T07_12993 [Trichinella nelsoni]|uniref:Uncharacterized protein n=1 Tax=Trichinella nelsoni TaxID=6336 RepID=A0A0V0RDG5_9BILA|nr:hypothetical protein T07_14532 [Trichinella nelsoni]KRX12731.1 hypothetical protein T07_12993 [Trichinella nelsoni]